MNTDFLLIGGGCGGLETALHLRKLVADATITIVNPQPYAVYRPWLIYLSAQRRRLGDLQISLHKAASAYRLHLVIDTVRQLDHQNRRALLASGEVIEYRSAVVATGAPADRERLPGSAQHALFPCDVEEALALQKRFLALKGGHVSVIIAGERPGPGLEYAGWLATAAQERGLTGRLHIQVVDDRESLRARLGESAMDIVAGFLERSGATLIQGQAVRAVHAEGIELENGMAWDSTLTTVVGPLRGTYLALPAPIVDERAFDVEKARRVAGMVMPDCGGQTVMVMLKNGRVLARGRWPLLLRAMVDRRSLKGRR